MISNSPRIMPPEQTRSYSHTCRSRILRCRLPFQQPERCVQSGCVRRLHLVRVSAETKPCAAQANGPATACGRHSVDWAGGPSPSDRDPMGNVSADWTCTPSLVSHQPRKRRPLVSSFPSLALRRRGGCHSSSHRDAMLHQLCTRLNIPRVPAVEAGWARSHMRSTSVRSSISSAVNTTGARSAPT